MTTKTKTIRKEKVKEEEDSEPVSESSTIEKVDEFLDEVDQLLEDQATLGMYIQRGGE